MSLDRHISLCADLNTKSAPQRTAPTLRGGLFPSRVRNWPWIAAYLNILGGCLGRIPVEPENFSMAALVSRQIGSLSFKTRILEEQ